MTICIWASPTRSHCHAASWPDSTKHAACVASAVPSGRANVPVAGGALVVDVTMILASYSEVLAA